MCLATGILSKTDYIKSLSDKIMYLDNILIKIHETGNRKLSEISSTRLTLASIFLSFTAVTTSIISLFN